MAGRFWEVVVKSTPTAGYAAMGAVPSVKVVPGFSTRDDALRFMATVVPVLGWTKTGLVRKEAA